MNTLMNDLKIAIQGFDDLPFAADTEPEELQSLDDRYSKWYNDLIDMFQDVENVLHELSWYQLRSTGSESSHE